jgi:effector-binding domain-containing protein
MSHKIEIKHVPEQRTAQTHFRARPEEMAARFGEAFGEVSVYLEQNAIEFEGPAFARYTRGDHYFDVDAGFILDDVVEGNGEVVGGTLPDCEALVTTHLGPYETLMEAYSDIEAWAKEHGRELDEPMWEYYFSGPDTPPAEIRTEVVWPLKAA